MNRTRKYPLALTLLVAAHLSAAPHAFAAPSPDARSGPSR